ncbi:MAG: beta-propeller fold lactonase family protein, partial [Bryobacterales bacterium]|nr:beta-propeller fold lactonase family protein [Bryobacterales bacterium]
MRGGNRRTAALVTALAMAGVIAAARKPGSQGPLSPTALAVAPGGRSLFVACSTGRQVLEFDLASRKVVRKVALPGEPSGLALSPGGDRLYVTCAAPASLVAVVETAGGKILETLPAGHTANSPAVSPDGARLYVCNRFNNDVAVIDLRSRTEVRRIPVEREPVASALTPDGRLLLVANHLHSGSADADEVAAAVTVVDPAAGRPVGSLRLPNGSGELQGIQVSPGGRYAAVTHVLARHQTPTSQIDRGWMNTNALSI